MENRASQSAQITPGIKPAECCPLPQMLLPNHRNNSMQSQKFLLYDHHEQTSTLEGSHRSMVDLKHPISTISTLSVGVYQVLTRKYQQSKVPLVVCLLFPGPKLAAACLLHKKLVRPHHEGSNSPSASTMSRLANPSPEIDIISSLWSLY